MHLLITLNHSDMSLLSQEQRDVLYNRADSRATFKLDSGDIAILDTDVSFDYHRGAIAIDLDFDLSQMDKVKAYLETTL